MWFAGLFNLPTRTHIRYTLVVLLCVSSKFLIIGSGRYVGPLIATPYKA